MNDSKSSPKRIDIKSPLGKALFGKNIGDIVQIEGLGKFVKIVNINND